MRYRVYVDEAGDRGISPSSSRHFVVSAIVVAENLDAQLRGELSELRASLDRHPEHVLHFVGFSHSQRLKAVQDVASSCAESIVSVILDKRAIANRDPGEKTARFSHPDSMYFGHCGCWSKGSHGWLKTKEALLPSSRLPTSGDFRLASSMTTGAPSKTRRIRRFGGASFEVIPFALRSRAKSSCSNSPTRLRPLSSRRSSSIASETPSLAT